ncbi:16S rRNA (uracil(1498)-N(3))-methyltransferase [Psychrosphaera sp. B3R10]|uniref:Ribosomal RNA small subunit methyltransferase E n=1 Tax=Psychrosphaera algicola TaxID=3023714 RepID=A0ABT5FJW9_9GAMM|nr:MULTISPECIES: 16S rRNA (uracil(1498)-N(3))-methyltransferase [unclassified Psychrosphaera]MBU2880891.1 16S rRNA (uracil(1498)-N(3))-methyltransferase [Psychrosphaera sp. I2R16]MBU2990890.1 16S rRNA (uracil(1498)-N(3))-methyltransferase [Psychrosphaera sp. B3R10]MDC2891471.1 16S rRNA (uracil(1498)-N(3))-methyltransferase [Psychrosphaera sp. G1-22]MDO6720586.1 16S rRNA (uracil(1498)-N(3))-methyltransferase [Psychrosphaera sp. 1_MG-2023]
MRIPRIYHSSPLQLNSNCELDSDAANHVAKVLRLKQGYKIILFNGDGHDYLSEITDVSKKSVQILPLEKAAIENESPLNIHLAQGISRGDKMDFTIQKSVELGIMEITPVFTERCGVKLAGERLEKKHQQWQKIAISACEQSGRAIIPVVHPPISLSEFLKQETNQLKLNLHPKASTSIKTITIPDSGVRFIIGPEGGLSDEEIRQAGDANYTDIQLGPRVLRTETAALTLLASLQFQFGDLA